MKNTAKKETPARAWRDRFDDWWWLNGGCVRLAISAVALLISIAAYFMA